MTTIVPERFPNAIIDYYNQEGNNAVTGYKIVNALTATTLGTFTLTSNTLYAYPFVIPSGGIVTEVAAYATAVTGTTDVRYGIYENYSDNTLYPSGLIWESAVKSLPGSNHKTTESPTDLVLERGKLYWLAIVASTGVTFRAVPVAASFPILGIDDNFGTSQYVGWSVSHTFGALPSAYTGGGALISTAQVAFGFKLTNI